MSHLVVLCSCRAHQGSRFARPAFAGCGFDDDSVERGRHRQQVGRRDPGVEGFRQGVGQAEELDFPLASFDTVTLFHVLEHVPDPVRLIRRCRDLLRPQGILAIAVPNDVKAWSSRIKKLGKRLGLGPFQKFSPVLGISRAGTSREIHLSHFTPDVLRRLLEESGFTLVEESLDPYYVSMGARLLLDSIYHALHRALHAALKVNYYDTIWIIARKP